MNRIIISLLILFASALGAMAGQPVADHVILIGLDGWGAYSVERADMPTVKELMDRGSYTLQKRSVLPSSSAPNWASMFMGVPTELHGYTKWGSETPDMPSRVTGRHGISPTVFEVVRNARPEAEIGAIYEWATIAHLVDTLSLSYHKHAQATNGAVSELTTQLAERYIADRKPDLLAVCYDEPDHTGHAAGHDTPEYYAKLHELDSYIARIVEATRKAGIYDNTVFILTADHGGINKGHGGITMAEMETPFIIVGKGISNRGRFDESMMQYDVAATIARLLGVSQPQVWVGRPMESVFEPEKN